MNFTSTRREHVRNTQVSSNIRYQPNIWAPADLMYPVAVGLNRYRHAPALRRNHSTAGVSECGGASYPPLMLCLLAARRKHCCCCCSRTPNYEATYGRRQQPCSLEQQQCVVCCGTASPKESNLHHELNLDVGPRVWKALKGMRWVNSRQEIDK